MRLLDFSDGFETDTTPTEFPASEVSFTPSGSLTSTDVQDAITELDTKKMARITSVANTVPRFNGTSGDVKETGVTVDDSNNMVTPGNLTVQGTTRTATLTPDGTHTLTLPTITDTVSTATSTETLSNKTIAAGSNTITGLTNSNVSGSAGFTNANLATMANGTVKGNLSGSTATPSDVTATSAATATTVAARDANGNLSTVNLVDGYTTTATAAGTTTLTVASNYQQFFTGSTTQTVVLPVVTTLVNGQQFLIANLSSGTVTVQSSGANTLQVMSTSTQLIATVKDTTAGTGTASWIFSYGPLIASGLTNPMTTAGDMIYGGSSGTPTRVVNGTSGQVPISAGSSVAFGTLPGNSTALKVATVQILTSGLQTGWLFTISTTSTCAVGDTYTNNSNTFTVQGALSAQSGQVLFMSGVGSTSGTTLTRTAGSGTSSITFSAKIATNTYTTPTGPAPLYLRVRMVGGGGGGGGGGTSGTVTIGNVGFPTFFGANILFAGGGAGGSSTYVAGGAPVVLSPAIDMGSITGNSGGGWVANGASNSIFLTGGFGGQTTFGSAGLGNANNAGGNAAANSGSGGGGGGAGSVVNTYGQSGGGAGGYVDAIISSPASTYPYVIGTAGSGGSAGTSGFAGGTGGAGKIIVEEHYQ